MIIEWAQAIISGIKKYQRFDNEVALFGKVLKNEIDEEFRYVQVHVRDTISVLLKSFLKEKHPTKSETDMQRTIEDIQSDKVPIETFYWTKIIERMYDDNDFELLKSKIRDFAKQKMIDDIQK